MNRHADWQSRLSEAVAKDRFGPFVWGETDCTQRAFDAISAVIDVDYGALYRGNYSDAKGALRILRKVDKVKTPAELMAKWFGETKPIAFARKGDIVTCDPAAVGFDLQDGTAAFGPPIGVCYGHWSYFTGPDGRIEIETLNCAKCFHVLKVETEA